MYSIGPTHGKTRILVGVPIEENSVKVGDLVLYKPDFAVRGVVCLIVNTLAGHGYYDALTPSGKIIFLSGDSVELISESR